MAVYTRTGDQGETSLLGKKIGKDNGCLWFIGEMDELNSILGVVGAFLKDKEKKKTVEKIQADLFLIGASLAGRKNHQLNPYLITRVKEIEKEIDRIEEKLAPLRHFILPGGSQAASFFHLLRSVCRRAERRVVELSGKQKIEEQILVFLNRLSDLFFVLARAENKKSGVKEKIWKKFS